MNNKVGISLATNIFIKTDVSREVFYLLSISFMMEFLSFNDDITAISSFCLFVCCCINKYVNLEIDSKVE